MAELRVSEQTPQRLRLVWTPEGQELEQGRGALIGVPSDGQVRLELIEARVARTDRAAEDDALTPGPVFLGASGFARRQRVVPVSFAPHVEADGTRTLYDRIVVDLHVTGGGGTRVADPWGEEFYRGMLVNPEQAKTWRLPLKQRPARKAALQEGTWLRISVLEAGMYRISGADLAAAGVSLDDVDPASLRLHYGGGKALSINEINPPQAMREVGLVVEDGGDGRLDADDFVLFWAESVSRWEYAPASRSFQYRHNLYTHENAYWLGFGGGGEGQRAEQRSGALAASDPQQPTSYRVRLHEEAEQFVLTQLWSIKSGYTWYWEDFRGNARNFPVVVRQAAPEPVAVRLGFIGIRGTRPRFSVRWNEATIGTVTFAIPEQPGSRRYVASDTLWAALGAQEGLNHLGIFHSGNPSRFDWYEVEYSRGFVAERGELLFSYPLTGTTQFRLAGFADEQPRVFEVSVGLAEVVDFAYDAQDGTVIFQDQPGDTPRQYLVGGPATWKRPVRIELDLPGDLTTGAWGADWVAIYHRDFRAAAERLAQWRAADDRFGRPLRTVAIDVQDIYDEFSGGLLDPTAIRNFLAYAAEHWDPAPMFVALVGDGSYDYKNNSSISQGNWIPAFQDGDSTYDEWYTRVVGGDLLADMAIGRLTVQTAAEADVVVDKIIAYDRAPEVGPWQSRVLLVSDDLLNRDRPDRVESFFIHDSEYMAEHILPETLDLTKLYIAQFPLEGREKPRARNEFIRLFNKGSLILTYVGHGSFDRLAHESLFLLSRDLDKLNNGGRLPLFFTAASQVGVFDDPVRISMPEGLLKKEDGGVIGMICATRIGYHSTNVQLANQFYRQLYHTGREHVPIGLALAEAKQLLLPLYDPTGAKTFRNIQRYSLFGDPATRLAQPRFQVQIAVADSLRALGEVAIAGQVFDSAGEPAPAYEGQVWLQAFDSSEESDLEGFTYEQTGAPIFRGRFPVVEGRFSAAFRVPKDITYGGRNGRISAYAWSDASPAAFGAVDGLVLAGTAAGVEADVEGPEIDLRFEGAKGTTIPRQTVLLASIADPSGINITGETGHEIELAIDDELFTLTELYSVQGGDYRQGVIEFPLPELETGKHEIRLKAWDSFNNSSRTTTTVQVADDSAEAAGLANVLFYPNPMRDSGYFTYELEDDMRTVQIEVFSLAGRLIEQLDGQTRAGYNQVPWIPPAELANGAYIYRIEAERESGAAVARCAVLQVAK